jgi:Abortive infection C-terminus
MSTSIGDDDATLWEIARPEGLNPEEWRAITEATARVVVARSRSDMSAVIGSAKEMCETVARVILSQRGPNLGSKAKFSELITEAHRAVERQPGEGLATDPPVRDVARGAKTIVLALMPLRNDKGTGHGRALPPDVVDEHGLIAGDAAFVWCRWALRRLGHYMRGDGSVLVNMLQQSNFYKGDLAGRLTAVALDQRSDEEALRVGVAVGQRATRETINVQEEGVNVALAEPGHWPAAYRGGLVEGLLFSADGTFTASTYSATAAARLLKDHPNGERLLHRLLDLVREASWTAPKTYQPTALSDVTATMRQAARFLEGETRVRWLDLANWADAIEPF